MDETYNDILNGLIDYKYYDCTLYWSRRALHVQTYYWREEAVHASFNSDIAERILSILLS
jgi:hypothetical protein